MPSKRIFTAASCALPSAGWFARPHVLVDTTPAVEYCGSMRNGVSLLCGGLLAAAALWPSPAHAVEVAPRISDREIVQALAELKAGQARLDQRIDTLHADMNQRLADMNQRLADMNQRFADMNQRFADVNRRFDDMNQRFDDMNRRFDTLQWMVGLFITVALAIFAAIAKNLLTLNRAQAAQERVVESLKTEIASLKETDLKLMDQITALIEHLKPPPHL